MRVNVAMSSASPQSNVIFNDSGLAVSFSIMGKKVVRGREYPALASAELSMMSSYEDIVDGNSELEEFILNLPGDPKNSKWYYYSRMIKPVGFIPANASVLLAQAVSKWADKEKAFILDELNPYAQPGEGLDFEGLKKFNFMYGFRLVRGNLMIRPPK